MSTVMRRTAIALLATALLVSCSGQDRPDADSWLAQWDAITAVVPELSELGDPPDESLCQDTLVALRTENEGLLPTPTSAVDDLAMDWVAVAEEAFFDCPPEGAESFDDAYVELASIERSVDAALRDQS